MDWGRVKKGNDTKMIPMKIFTGATATEITVWIKIRKGAAKAEIWANIVIKAGVKIGIAIGIEKMIREDENVNDRGRNRV